MQKLTFPIIQTQQTLNQMQKLLFFSCLLGISLLVGCWSVEDSITPPDFPEGEVQGYKPIYVSTAEIHNIKMMPPQNIEQAGKILLNGTTLLVSDKNRGIHIIDNTNPSNPIKRAFISIPGNKELSKRGDYLYVDNYTDLVTIKVLSFDSVAVLDRKTDVFQNEQFPTFSGYFECVDNSKGLLVDWERTTIVSPKCYR
jgi:hypothetical protein